MEPWHLFRPPFFFSLKWEKTRPAERLAVLSVYTALIALYEKKEEEEKQPRKRKPTPPDTSCSKPPSTRQRGRLTKGSKPAVSGSKRDHAQRSRLSLFLYHFIQAIKIKKNPAERCPSPYSVLWTRWRLRCFEAMWSVPCSKVAFICSRYKDE